VNVVYSINQVIPRLSLKDQEQTLAGSQHLVFSVLILLVLASSSIACSMSVAEPPELFRHKCASHRYTADTNSTHFKRNTPLASRVSARCNHGSTGLKQVYLARRRVYNCTIAHQLLIHRILNIITNHFNLSILIQILFKNHKLCKLG
jgi:hypothetical protein